MEIRPAKKSDMKWIAPAITRFHMDDEDLEYSQFSVATLGGENAGFVRIKPYADCHELGCVGVIEEFRGRSVAKALVRHAIGIFPSKLVWITTDIPSFFENLGFKRVPKSQSPRVLAEKIETVCPAKGRKGCVVMLLKKPAA